MNSLIVLIIFAAIGLINYIVRQSAATPRRPGAGPRRLPPQDTLPRSQRTGQMRPDTQDERLRQFMEALGVPAEVPPPRKIERPPAVPASRFPPPVKRQVQARKIYTPPPPVPEQSSYQAETVAAAPPPMTGYDEPTRSYAAVTGAPSASAAATSPAADFKSLLRSPSSIRAAMVLKEILGAPRGLQPMDTIPGLR